MQSESDHVVECATETEPKVQMHLDMIDDIDRMYRAHDAQARNSGKKDTKTP